MSAPVIVNMTTGTARFIDDTPQVGDVVMVPHRELADALSEITRLKSLPKPELPLWPIVFCVALSFMIGLAL